MKRCNILMFTAGLAFVAGVANAATATADFTQEIGHLRKALHSSGWAPRSYPRSIQNDDANVSAMNMAYARTHDWALVNDGQRVVDYQYIFPLFHLDAKEPTNYVFEPTDHLLGLARNIGLDIFYRLGTSIEHTGNIHFNARVPKDFDKTAEIFAGIIRHYNKGWANGHQWNIKYWELWNEPDGITNMWWLPEAEGGKDREKMRDLFIKLFVTCLKRLKAEFPEVKVGGPALCSMKPGYFRPLLQACKDAGVAPDFISWHYYGSNPDAMVKSAEDARKMCDEYGFTKCELILNEWHYILTWDGIHGNNSTPEAVKKAQQGPSGHNNIDSACFTLASLVKFQTSKLDQAYYYGCGAFGNWGYLDGYRQPNKNWYACRMFGDLVKNYSAMYATSAGPATASALALKSKDGKNAALLVVDYRGGEQTLTVDMKGLDAAKKTSAILLDHTHNATPCDAVWQGGTLTLKKPDINSAAFLVTFEL